jgi:hypothetical protein
LIQYTLPSFAVYAGNFKKRIGIFHSETIPNNIPIAELTHESLMDEIWVDSKVVATQLQNIFQYYNTSTIVRAIPPILNLNELLLEQPSTQTLRNASPHLKDKFIFYYIGNILDSQSGFKEVYTAYLNTFTAQDPVALVVALDTALPGQAIQQCFDSYKKEIAYNTPERFQPLLNVLPPQGNFLSDEERISLHRGGDCMISLGYSMASNFNVLEGALYHSMPIVNRNGPIHEWLGDENVWCVDSYEEVCMRNKDTLPSGLYRYTFGESWYRPIVKSIVETMKEAYSHKFKRDNKIKSNKELQQFFENNSLNNYISI